jgi:hypothetical protein
MYPNSCMSRFLQDDEKHAASRSFFCDWFENYLAARGIENEKNSVGDKWIATARARIPGTVNAA